MISALIAAALTEAEARGRAEALEEADDIVREVTEEMSDCRPADCRARILERFEAIRARKEPTHG